ncbi:MAG: hypothetical protein LBK25_01955 [Treponema sp.]|jgi:hypothetical protein|nr:hypothetical protein [Treponema sp.]
MSEIAFDIVKNYGILSEEKSGWKKEVNLISWNNRDPKFDIRDWDPYHEKMGKGVTLSREEAKKLVEMLTVALSETK